MAHDALACQTDENGEVTLDSLPAGKISVSVRGGVRKPVTVIPADQTTLVFTIKRTTEVHGIVLSPNGQPVGGADVYTASYQLDWLSSQYAITTAQDGTFVLPYAQNSISLGAVANGFAPSKLVDLDQVETKALPVQVTLTLQAGGGALEGKIYNQNGEPVVGARVAVGHSPTSLSVRRDETTAETWGVRSTKTDANGDYRMEGLQGGTQPFYVSANEYVLYKSEVEVFTDNTAKHDAHLRKGMVVTGTVRNEQQEPIEGALILALHEYFLERFPGQGPTDRSEPFHQPATRSDATGAYRLTALPAGELFLYSSKGTSFWDDDHFIGDAQISMSGGESEELRWDPILKLGNLIHGRVQFSDGTPMENTFVGAFHSNGTQMFDVSKTDGSFSISGLENASYRVTAQVNQSPADAPPVENLDVWPSDSGILLTATFPKDFQQKGTVRVRVDDTAKRFTSGGHSVNFSDDEGWVTATEKDGVYKAKLPVGRYQVMILAEGGAAGLGPWFELGPGEDLDLGTMQTGGTGSLTVRVQRPRGMESTEVSVRAWPEYVYNGERTLSEGTDECQFDNLLEGSTRLLVMGTGIAFSLQDVAIEAGRNAQVTVQPKKAAPVQFTIEGSPANGFLDMEFRIQGPGDKLYFERTYSEKWGVRLPHTVDLYVPVGTYAVSVTTRAGLSATSTLRVLKANGTYSIRLPLE